MGQTKTYGFSIHLFGLGLHGLLLLVALHGLAEVLDRVDATVQLHELGDVGLGGLEHLHLADHDVLERVHALHDTNTR